MATINDNIKQVSTVLNTVLDKAYGKTALTNVDTTDLSSVFDYVTSTSITKTVFFESLYAVFSDQIFANRVYEGARAPIWRNEAEFGQLILKTYTEPIEAGDNEIYTVTNGMEASLFKVALADVKSAIIEKSQTWQVALTVANDQLKSAFSNADALGAFLEQQYVELENSMADEMEKMENMLVASYIALKLNAAEDGGIQAVNVLAEYNTTMGTSLTVADALQSREFLNFANSFMLLKLKQMEKRTKVFNTEDFVRHTPKSAAVVMMLNDYVQANVNILSANTFHQELISYPKYTNIPYWQAMGVSGEFESVSKIDITNQSGTVSQSGILAVIFDEYAIASTLKDRSNESEYSKRYGLQHTWNRATVQYYCDPSENGFVMYISD